MSIRHDLNRTYDQLRATLARAERTLPLSQPLRSAELYAEAIASLGELTERLQARVDQARKVRP